MVHIVTELPQEDIKEKQPIVKPSRQKCLKKSEQQEKLVLNLRGRSIKQQIINFTYEQFIK